MMVSLSFYGMKALWNRDRALLKISHSRSQCQRNQSIFLLHAWTGKYRDSHDSLMTVVSLVPEAVTRKCSVKKLVIEILRNSLENTCAGNFIKKETLAQVFSC